MNKTKRLTVRFDEGMWKLLVSLAEKEKTTVGDLVRNAVRKVWTLDSIEG